MDRFKEEHGVAMVEFALVLPLVLLLLLGVFTFGRAINYWIEETHLSAEAARYAAVGVNPGPGGSIAASVQRQADTRELRDGGGDAVADPAQLCIDFPEGADVGKPVRAQMSVRYALLPFIGSRIGAAEVTITGSAQMRLETQPTYAAHCAS